MSDLSEYLTTLEARRKAGDISKEEFHCELLKLLEKTLPDMKNTCEEIRKNGREGNQWHTSLILSLLKDRLG